MPKFDIRIEDTNEHYSCLDTRSLLEAMEALGRRGIPVGCRNGGCGVCKVRITSGTYSARVMSRAHVTAEEEKSGCALACRVKPTSDISLVVLGKMKKSVVNGFLSQTKSPATPNSVASPQSQSKPIGSSSSSSFSSSNPSSSSSGSSEG